MTDGEFDQSTENNTLNYPLVAEHFQRANFQFDPSKRHREIARAEHNASSTGSGGDFSTLNRALNRSSAVASSRADDRNGSFSFRQFFRKLASDSSLQTRSNLQNKVCFFIIYPWYDFWRHSLFRTRTWFRNYLLLTAPRGICTVVSVVDLFSSSFDEELHSRTRVGIWITAMSISANYVK
jgi:hypothetical protein